MKFENISKVAGSLGEIESRLNFEQAMDGEMGST